MVVRTVSEASASTMRRLYSSCADASWRNDGNGSDGIHNGRDKREDRPGAAIVSTGFRPLHDHRIDAAADRLVCLLQRTDLHPHLHSCGLQAADESLGGIVPEEADHRDPLLHTDIQLSLLGKLRDEVHTERSRGHGSGHANELT